MEILSYIYLVLQGILQELKDYYQNGYMRLMGSNLMYRSNVKFAHSLLYQCIFYGVLFYCLFYIPSLLANGYVNDGTGASVGEGLVWIAVTVYIVCGMLLCIFDVDTVECSLRNYKKSSYYLATKEELKKIARKDGLIGEYKGYVLSRTLSVPHKVLHNVCIPMRNGSFQEVDTIIITRNIIYVVECKNRVGRFIGNYDDKKWIRRFGRKEEETTENIYIQNQKHTIALDQFLLERGIIQNGQNVCINVLLTTGKMTLSLKGSKPLDFVAGDARKIGAYIESQDKKFDDGTDTSGIMNKIYEALLPYALYSKNERAMMMGERRVRSLTKEFAVGEFQIREVTTGIAGVTNPGEKAEIRSNRLYTQVKITVGNKSCWQTRTDIGNKNCLNHNPISTGVDKQRVEEFKQSVGEEPRLILKRVIWIAFGISSMILLRAAGMI